MARSAVKTKPSDTNTFEGKQVVGAAVKITRAGDGLSEALKLDPQELHHGEEVWIVIHGKVANVAFPPVPKADGILTRLHTVAAIECVMVAPDEVEALLERERDRVLKLKEEAAGIARLPMNDDPLGILDDDKTPSDAPASEPDAPDATAE